MRTRPYQVTLAAALLLGAGLTTSRAENDSFWSDLDTPVTATSGGSPETAAPKSFPTKSVDAANVPQTFDMTPTHSIAPGSATVAQEASRPPVGLSAKTTAVANPVKARPAKADGLDPEPDVAIRPPTRLSNDPLDVLTPPQVNPDGAKPLDALSPEGIDPSGDPDLAKPAFAKPAFAKPAPAKPSVANPTAPATTGSVDQAGPGAPEPLAPLNAALKAALDKRETVEIKGPHAATRRKEREALAFFYAAHGFAPIWSANGRAVAAADPVLARLAEAGDDALTLTAVPKRLRTEGTPAEIADSELALSEAVFSYARQAAGSRVDPLTISPLIGLKRELADPAEALEAIVAAGSNAGDKLRAFNPSDPRYVALREKLVSLRTNHETPSAPTIAAGPTLKVGMRDPRVPVLRARFGIEPSLEPDDDPIRYDDKVAAAVRAFQHDNDLPPSGTLTKRTVAALSGEARPSRQVGTIIATMEMWRWMPRTLGANHIEVNVPDYLVTVYKDGVVNAQHRVVVGKTDTPTPLFANAMKYLIVNPYWNVPQSIIKKELLPKGHGSLNYLEGRGYSVSYKGDLATVKQLPGDKNALGRIKFLFPNDYSVYLHDTPSKSLFAASKRAFSHGCVRVDQPFSFAESVLDDAAPSEGGKHWSEEKLEDLIGEKERYINLARPLPIVIEYFTASIEPDTGQLKLREDVYGYTHAVATALGQDSEPAPEQHKPAPLVAERAPRKSTPRSAEPREPAGDRTAEAAPSPMRSFFGGIFDPR